VSESRTAKTAHWRAVKAANKAKNMSRGFVLAPPPSPPDTAGTLTAHIARRSPPIGPVFMVACEFPFMDPSNGACQIGYLLSAMKTNLPLRGGQLAGTVWSHRIASL